MRHGKQALGKSLLSDERFPPCCLHVQIDTGDPALHKAIEQLERSGDDIKSTQDRVSSVQQQVQLLSDDTAETATHIHGIKDAVQAAEQAHARLQTRVAADVQRLTAYTDDSIKPLAHKYDVEDLKATLESIRGELKGDVLATKETVKFELLHEKSPHVTELKQFIKLQETNQARLNERLALAEEAVKVARSQALEASSQLAAIMADASGTADQSLTTAAAVATLEHALKRLTGDVQSLRRARDEGGGMSRDAAEAMVVQATAAALATHAAGTSWRSTDDEVRCCRIGVKPRVQVATHRSITARIFLPTY